nr:hypothetical protein [Roseomonas sp. AR75]
MLAGAEKVEQPRPGGAGALREAGGKLSLGATIGRGRRDGAGLGPGLVVRAGGTGVFGAGAEADEAAAAGFREGGGERVRGFEPVGVFRRRPEFAVGDIPGAVQQMRRAKVAQQGAGGGGVEEIDRVMREVAAAPTPTLPRRAGE